MRKSLVVVTWAGNLEQTFPSFISSLGVYRKYPLIVVVNEAPLLSLEDRQFLNSNFQVLENSRNLWECGAISAVMNRTNVDEFILLQDTMIIQNPSIFEVMFEEFPNRSISFGLHWRCFFGKYRRAILEQISLPTTTTKEHAMYQEVALVREYLGVESKIECLFPEWGDDNPANWVEDRFGRTNLVLFNPYILKYKGTVASDKDGFKTTELTWEQLEDNWNRSGVV